MLPHLAMMGEYSHGDIYIFCPYNCSYLAFWDFCDKKCTDWLARVNFHMLGPAGQSHVFSIPSRSVLFPAAQAITSAARSHSLLSDGKVTIVK